MSGARPACPLRSETPPSRRPPPSRSYNEYFQWSPEHNYNSDSHSVKAGDVLFGSVRYNPENNSYTAYHSDMNSGWSVTTSIPIQRTRVRLHIPRARCMRHLSRLRRGLLGQLQALHDRVLRHGEERRASRARRGDRLGPPRSSPRAAAAQYDCSQYPPNNEVVFYDIKVEYDNQAVTPSWTTGIVDDHCNCRAHVLNGTSISITWDSNASSRSGVKAAPAGAVRRLHSGLSAKRRAAVATATAVPPTGIRGAMAAELA